MTETAQHTMTMSRVSNHLNAHKSNEEKICACLSCTMLSAEMPCVSPNKAGIFDHKHNDTIACTPYRQRQRYVTRCWRFTQPKGFLGTIQPSSGDMTHIFQQIYIDHLLYTGKGRGDGVHVPEAPAIDLRATTGRDKHTALQAIATISDLECGCRNKIYVN